MKNNVNIIEMFKMGNRQLTLKELNRKINLIAIALLVVTIGLVAFIMLGQNNLFSLIQNLRGELKDEKVVSDERFELLKIADESIERKADNLKENMMWRMLSLWAIGEDLTQREIIKIELDLNNMSLGCIDWDNYNFYISAVSSNKLSTEFTIYWRDGEFAKQIVIDRNGAICTKEYEKIDCTELC